MLRFDISLQYFLSSYKNNSQKYKKKKEKYIKKYEMIKEEEDNYSNLNENDDNPNYNLNSNRNNKGVDAWRAEPQTDDSNGQKMKKGACQTRELS